MCVCVCVCCDNVVAIGRSQLMSRANSEWVCVCEWANKMLNESLWEFTISYLICVHTHTHICHSSLNAMIVPIVVWSNFSSTFIISSGDLFTLWPPWQSLMNFTLHIELNTYRQTHTHTHLNYVHTCLSGAQFCWEFVESNLSPSQWRGSNGPAMCVQCLCVWVCVCVWHSIGIPPWRKERQSCHQHSACHLWVANFKFAPSHMLMAMVFTCTVCLSQLNSVVINSSGVLALKKHWPFKCFLVSLSLPLSHSWRADRQIILASLIWWNVRCRALPLQRKWYFAFEPSAQYSHQ